MKTQVIVVGHRNPDNDAICSAVGYAYLKNELAKRNGTADEVSYIPARLGPLPPETEWILKKSGVDIPEVIPHVHARVVDVMTFNPIGVSEHATIMEAGRVLRKRDLRSLIVTDDEGYYKGLITTRSIANRFISATDQLDSADANNFAVAANLIESLGQKVSELMDVDVLQFDPESLLHDATQDLLRSTLREGVVLNEKGKCIGIITRTDVADQPKRQVILVDHNEVRQAALGIEEADVVEIVDHHRIADIMTTNPIQFLNLPVGSTSTIVTMEFRRYGVEIPPSIAAVLLSAIMTDTVILKSPTATLVDEEQVNYLADIVGVDPTDFGISVFKTRGGEDDMPVHDLVEADSKEFQIADYTILIAQHETVDLDAVMAREEEIREYMQQLVDVRGYRFALLLVTDIIKEGSQFIAVGDCKLVNRVFGIECDAKGGGWMPGILSRKKQVAPRLLSA